MFEPKGMKHADRQATSAAAKKALLERFKPKPTVTDPNMEARKAAEAAELERVRAERNAALAQQRMREHLAYGLTSILPPASSNEVCA